MNRDCWRWIFEGFFKEKLKKKYSEVLSQELNKKHNALHVTPLHVDASRLPFMLNMTKKWCHPSDKSILEE